MFILNSAMVGMIILMIRNGESVVYPGFIIYAQAAYTFYILTFAIINMVRYKRNQMPIIAASKAIDLVAAIMSLFILQVSMINQFGGNEMFSDIINTTTGTMTSFPLMPHVGNAILDYKQNGRPQTEEDTIIVSHIATNRGKPISDSNAASIVVKYMTIAGIDGFTGRKHGPHVFRHSVATNMLNNRESLTTIQSVLGHKSTETTKEYLSLDLLSLRNCAVDVPEIVNNPLF